MLLIAIMVAGCLDEPVRQEMGECWETTDDLWWGDSYQWNSAPMSYGNTTNWTMNNTSDGMLAFLLILRKKYGLKLGQQARTRTQKATMEISS